MSGIKTPKSKESISNERLFNKIREKLKVTKKQLPDKVIKSVIKLNNKLIGDWVINNADGFRIKDNGIIIVSKYLPKCLRGDKLEKIEEIMNNPKNDDYMKEMFTKRYTKSIEYYKDWNKNKPFINLHSFFYLYRILWFNSRNCKFDKAEIYQLEACIALKKQLNKKIIQGKEYFEWQFSDFRERKRDTLTPEKLRLREERKRKREELKNKKNVGLQLSNNGQSDS